MRARVPRRPRANGWLPVPGWTGAHDWRGWIPHEAMPCTIDPPGGVIVTANNRVVADDHPDHLCTDRHPAYRAERIAERLAELAPFRPQGFAHPLSALVPEAAGHLDPPSRPIGGDGDTVLATGLAPALGTAATYGALARYVFDVGDWGACRWAVFHGASGHPGSPHYADQNAPWSACAMVPMLYDRDAIAREARTTQTPAPVAAP